MGRVAALLVAALVGVVSVRAQPLELDITLLSWSELDFKARKSILTATSELRVRPAEATEMAESLIPADGREELPRVGDDLLLMTLRSKVPFNLSHVRLWLDPRNARSYQVDELNPGSRPRYRAYRPMKKGVRRTTMRPASGEKKLPYQDWSEREEKFIDYSEEVGERVVSEALALFVVASTANLNAKGDAVTLPVFVKDRVIEVRLEVLDERKHQVKFEQVRAGKTRTIKGKRRALLVAVSAAIPEGDEGTKLELLGLEGDIEMTIDAETRVPLQISGKIPIAGLVDVKLTRVVLNAPQSRRSSHKRPPTSPP